MFLLPIMYFFDANSSVLTWEGQEVLYSFAKAIAPATGRIEQVNIMSHTAKVTDNSQINPQTIRKDRILSAMRSQKYVFTCSTRM